MRPDAHAPIIVVSALAAGLLAAGCASRGRVHALEKKVNSHSDQISGLQAHEAADDQRNAAQDVSIANAVTRIQGLWQEQDSLRAALAEVEKNARAVRERLAALEAASPSGTVEDVKALVARAETLETERRATLSRLERIQSELDLTTERDRYEAAISGVRERLAPSPRP